MRRSERSMLKILVQDVLGFSKEETDKLYDFEDSEEVMEYARSLGYERPTFRQLVDAAIMRGCDEFQKDLADKIKAYEQNIETGFDCDHCRDREERKFVIETCSELRLIDDIGYSVEGGDVTIWIDENEDLYARYFEDELHYFKYNTGFEIDFSITRR